MTRLSLSLVLLMVAGCDRPAQADTRKQIEAQLECDQAEMAVMGTSIGSYSRLDAPIPAYMLDDLRVLARCQPDYRPIIRNALADGQLTWRDVEAVNSYWHQSYHAKQKAEDARSLARLKDELAQ